MKNIAVLTSGGDSSGMNSALKVIFDQCKKQGYNLYGVMRGYKGLLENNFVLLNDSMVENIFSFGGSVIKCSRCPEFVREESKILAKQYLEKNNIDFLIIIGGNGSIKGANDLSKYFKNVICLPGTIDNDMEYTDQTIGFDTAVNNAVNAVKIMMSSMEANDRGFIVETMGRHCDDIAVKSAISLQADVVITKKVSYEEILTSVNEVLNRKTSPLIIVKEYLFDIKELAHFLESQTGQEFRSCVLGYLQRGGEPTINDKNLASQFAIKAIELVMENKGGYAIGTKNGNVITETLEIASK